MIMRFTEIGQQLRAYRLETGMRAEEIAARLGVSRAALYRYEKGEVIKLDTVNRLAELLNISPLSLLGIGVEYYTRPIGYLERLRQIEETADQILQWVEPPCELNSTEAYDNALATAFAELSSDTPEHAMPLRAAGEQVRGVLLARKRVYAQRRQSIICLLTLEGLRQFLVEGVAGSLVLSPAARQICRRAARTEIEMIAATMDSEPMGLQFGLLSRTTPTGRFTLLRGRDRALLAINPFRADMHPLSPLGVAMITAADEAINAHQRAAEAAWQEATKGPAAAKLVRELMATIPAG